MTPRTPRTALACGLAAATLLLSACGGDGDERITAATPGTPAGAPSGAASPAAPAPGAPTFDFPPDVKVVVDPDVTGDPAKDAVLRDQGYGLRAVYVALSRLDGSLPVLSKYLTLEAAKTWRDSITWGQRYHRSVTGTVKFYDRRVGVMDASSAGITFCEDQSHSYDKDAVSGKVFTTKPSSDDFVLHTARMVKSGDGTWQMANYKSQKAAAPCRR